MRRLRFKHSKKRTNSKNYTLHLHMHISLTIARLRASCAQLKAGFRKIERCNFVGVSKPLTTTSIEHTKQISASNTQFPARAFEENVVEY